MSETSNAGAAARIALLLPSKRPGNRSLRRLRRQRSALLPATSMGTFPPEFMMRLSQGFVAPCEGSSSSEEATALQPEAEQQNW
jgi:hypothetical protein